MSSQEGRVEEFQIKLGRTRDYLQRKGLDGVYLKKRSNFSWITCGGDNRIIDHSEEGWSGVLVTMDRAVLITDNTEMPRIVDEEIAGLPLETHEYVWYKSELADAITSAAGGKNVSCDLRIETLKELEPDFDRIQYQLTEHEIDRYRELGSTTSKVFTKIGGELRPGMSELDVTALVSFELMKKHIQPHLILVATDNRISDYRHPIPTAQKIERYVMYVTVAVKWGLNLSMTRFVHFGRPSEELRAKHNAIVNIDGRLILNTRPGRRLVDIFKSHKDNYAAFGYPDEWKKLHQGGSASYRPRDVKLTMDTPESESVLLNQAYAWNPTITGIKSEDTIVILEGGNEILSEDTAWPLLEVEVDGQVVKRPGLLLR